MKIGLAAAGLMFIIGILVLAGLYGITKYLLVPGIFRLHDFYKKHSRITAIILALILVIIAILL